MTELCKQYLLEMVFIVVILITNIFYVESKKFIERQFNNKNMILEYYHLFLSHSPLLPALLKNATLTSLEMAGGPVYGIFVYSCNLCNK